jgi:hypothetical protein
VGERKSAIFRLLTRHIHDVEAEQNIERKGEASRAEAERVFVQGQIAALEGKVKKADDPAGQEVLKKELAELIERRGKIPAVPDRQLVCEDTTPEALVKHLAEQDGRMLQTSAEGTPLEIIKGRYNTSANFDPYLKGHSGDFLRVGRVTRDGHGVEHPALSVLIMAQPDVVEGLATDASLAGRGLLARFLFAVPASKVGSRVIAPPPVDPAVEWRFTVMMRQLWFSGKNERKYAPRKVTFSAEAEAILRAFEAALEPRLGEQGDLHGMTIEIAADFPAGVSDAIKRAVSENASSLGFTTKDWE